MSDGASPASPRCIVIDGPAGAGKSTVGAALARRLGLRYFDTGLLYRAVTLAAQRRGVAPTDAPRLAALAADLDLAFEPPAVDDGRQVTVLLGGEDVTWALRDPVVNEQVSVVAAQPAVRQALLQRQREMARQGVVMVGRDIGTTVLPDAEVKIYLDASVEERAARRLRDRQARGEPATLAEERANVIARDALDSQRAASPLRAAEDAIYLDTDGLSVDEVVARLQHLCREARVQGV